jgi:septal ring factor EnvC (AmiA/AmiB activator)
MTTKRTVFPAREGVFMKKKLSLLVLFLGMALLVSTGCTKKPSPDELNKLTEARQAAEAAEKKLADLKAERTQLEATLEAKKEELKKAEAERDSIKAKLGN